MAHLPLPNLDDLTYADLVDAARSQIPLECPEWTDHNPSDTGIILLELFAWLTEMTLYRVNQIPDKNQEMMLNLLRSSPPQSEVGLTGASLQAALTDTLLDLRQRYRAVTPADYEQLTLQDWNQSEMAQALGQVDRVRCLPQVNLTAATSDRDRQLAPGHISLVILPKSGTWQPTDALKQHLWFFLDSRRLLTTQLHVVAPDYVSLTIRAALRLHEGVPKTVQSPGKKDSSLRQRIASKLNTYFDPWVGGKLGEGWPFGRPVYLSDVYKLLDDIPEVDYVESLALNPPTDSSPERLSAPLADSPKSIPVAAHQLVRVASSELTLRESWEPPP